MQIHFRRGRELVVPGSLGKHFVISEEDLHIPSGFQMVRVADVKTHYQSHSIILRASSSSSLLAHY